MTPVMGGLLLLAQTQGADVYSAKMRWRLSRVLYALAQGGTRLYPRTDGTLLPVTFASFHLRFLGLEGGACALKR